MLQELQEDLAKRGTTLAIVNPSKFVLKTIDLTGFTKQLGRENLFITVSDAIASLKARPQSEVSVDVKFNKEEAGKESIGSKIVSIFPWKKKEAQEHRAKQVDEPEA